MVDNQQSPEVNEQGELKQPESPKEYRKGKYGEWILIGYTSVKGQDPKNQVPIWQYDWDRIHKYSKYPPSKVRQLRNERGVSKPKKY